MKATPCTIDGIRYASVRAAARALNIHPNTAYFRANKRRVLDANAAWHKRNPERSRAMRRRHRGLPTPTRLQPKGCEICSKPPAPGKTLHLDHDHKTGEFRGWLCSKCNTGLGLFKDNMALLAAAAAYIEESL